MIMATGSGRASWSNVYGVKSIPFPGAKLETCLGFIQVNVDTHVGYCGMYLLFERNLIYVIHDATRFYLFFNCQEKNATVIGH